MKYHSRILAAVLGLALFLAACGDATTRKKMQGMPTAYGNINQIAVLCDAALWESPVGDTLRYYFEAPYLLLPQPEPLYDLVHFTPQDLVEKPVRREMKLYLVLADLADTSSPTTRLVLPDLGPETLRSIREGNGYRTSIGKDKWALGQLLFYLMGFGEDLLIENIRTDFATIAQRIEQEQLPRIEATAYQGGEETRLVNEIRDQLGIQLRVPRGFKKAILDLEEPFMWIRKDNPEVNINILIHKTPYTEASQLTKEGLKAIQNRLGRKYISTTFANTYMRINDEDLPLFVEPTKINGYYALEARGVWDIVNDYMGGPFISYLIHDPNRNELVFLCGFVHAPGEEKRNIMQQLEFVLRTVRF